MAPLSMPHFERLLAAASVAVADPIECWLCAALGIARDRDPPVAALRLASEDNPAIAAQARDGYWLCADPVTASVGMDSVHIGAVVDDLSVDDAAALIRSLDEVFAADGLRFIAPSPSRWYVRSVRANDISTTSVDRMRGRSMLARLPSGTDASAWRSRMNEVQMLLHSHPVNAARVDRGQEAVASCWWWGGGRWPAFSGARFDRVIGGPPWVHAACGANGVDVQMPSSDAGVDAIDARERVLMFVESAAMNPPSDSWGSVIDAALGPLVDRRRDRADSRATIVVPWIDETLVIDVPPPKRDSGWRRLFGRRDAPAPAIGAALREYLQ